MATDTTPTLPERPGALLRVALRDLRHVERDPRYEVQMGFWHTGTAQWGAGDDPCAVCLAGAVMARTLGADPGVLRRPWDYSEEVGRKLIALDALRCGSVAAGLAAFYGEAPETYAGRIADVGTHPWYDTGALDGNRDWYAAMERMADWLTASGH